MNSDHAYIHQEWHRAASTRDTPALIALYADHAILENEAEPRTPWRTPPRPRRPALR